MPHFEVDGEIDLQPDDELTIVDAVRPGDLIYFERVAAHEVQIRVPASGDPATAPGPVYRVDRGSAPDTILFTQVK